ncbi:drug/metabolite transporter (DMT)-like permease [Actinoplanes couchii]|nr:DMT family transporter [Actinoplanes couchii]MDR6319331.1 drug/metabolite transporter (DMT)-like permease [Actinoplanes couchii]
MYRSITPDSCNCRTRRRQGEGDSRQRNTGLAALGLAVLLWASFALTIRGIGGSGLTAVDVAVLRFVTPVLLLTPWLPRAVRAVRRERPGVVACLCLAGLPHFLLAAWGGSLSSAALVGLLLPGSVPLFVALIHRTRRGINQTLALAAIVAGVATLLTATGILPSRLTTAPLPDILLFTALQGVGTGVLSTLSYAYAVRRLGSSLPAVCGALSPVLTTLLAVPLFGEPITAGTIVALTLIVGGVIGFHSSVRPGRGQASDVGHPADLASARGGRADRAGT